MFRNLNTPIQSLKDALKKVESKMDSCDPPELPALMAVAHELACIIDIRKDIETLTRRGHVYVSKGGHTAMVTPSDVIVFGDTPEGLVTYCRKIQNIVQQQGDKNESN